jgi:glyoxylase-like metal-dependent hydrolase (beta-lactamase superfamily II)
MATRIYPTERWLGASAVVSTLIPPFIPALILSLLVLGCGDSEVDPAEGPAEVDESALDVPRTADPTARGLTTDDFPRVQEVASGVFTYEALRSAGEELFTTVSMFVVTESGVLVADGQGNVEETERMIAAIALETDQPVTHVVVSSDHGDHTGGNSAFPEGVEFIAHPTSAALLRTPPARIVEDRETLQVGGRSIELLFLGRAHTGGDLLVHLPEEKILFMSEAYLNRVFPAMRSAYPSEWIEVLDRALAMELDLYIPGHGFVEAAAVLHEELETYRAAVQAVVQEATRLHAAGVPVDQAAEQAAFGDLETWSLRSSQGATAIRRVYAELNGELPGG